MALARKEQNWNTHVSRVASMLHGIPGTAWERKGIRGFPRDGLVVVLDSRKPAVWRAKVLTFLGKELVAGVGFEPTTIRL